MEAVSGDRHGADDGADDGRHLLEVHELARLVDGHRALMRRLYEPGNYYRRCRTFLASYRPGGPRVARPPRDLLALLRSLWLLGVRHRGRTAYWLFFWSTLLGRPRQMPPAVELSIFGHHYRQVAARLQ